MGGRSVGSKLFGFTREFIHMGYYKHKQFLCIVICSSVTSVSSNRRGLQDNKLSTFVSSDATVPVIE